MGLDPWEPARATSAPLGTRQDSPNSAALLWEMEQGHTICDTSMQNQAKHVQGKSYRSKNCHPPPFLAVPGHLSLEYLLKLQTQSLWEEELWMGEEKGGHNPPSTDASMLLDATAWLHSFPDPQTAPVSALDPLTTGSGAVRIETFSWHVRRLRVAQAEGQAVWAGRYCAAGR